MQQHQTDARSDALRAMDFLAWRVTKGKEEAHRQEVKHIMALRPRQRSETRH